MSSKVASERERRGPSGAAGPRCGCPWEGNMPYKEIKKGWARQRQRYVTSGGHGDGVGEAAASTGPAASTQQHHRSSPAKTIPALTYLDTYQGPKVKLRETRLLWWMVNQRPPLGKWLEISWGKSLIWTKIICKKKYILPNEFRKKSLFNTIELLEKKHDVSTQL